MDVGVPAVPGDELGRRDAAGQVLAGDVETLVAAGAERVDHRVHAAPQLVGGQVLADRHVAVEPHAGLLQRPLQGVADRADRRVVGRDAVADQPERHRQPVQHGHVDRHVALLGEGLGGVDAGRSGADDRHHEGWRIVGRGSGQWRGACSVVRHGTNLAGRRIVAARLSRR